MFYFVAGDCSPAFRLYFFSTTDPSRIAAQQSHAALGMLVNPRKVWQNCSPFTSRMTIFPAFILSLHFLQT